MNHNFKSTTKLGNKPKLRKRRGVGEVISAMLLVGITVAGAGILSYFVHESLTSTNVANASTLDSSTKNVKLLAYDTRDSDTLLDISNLNNKFGDQRLCGTSCAGQSKLPSQNGTEFIIIKITNNELNSIFLHNIQINNIVHEWDPQTSGVTLNTLYDLTSGGNYPRDGKFSIFSDSSTVQYTSNEIEAGKTNNLLIKLGPNDNNILLNKSIRVLLNVGGMHPIEFFIESGNAQ
jgi:FlaG/FlaF family flagellin (archaellin)